MSETPKTDRIDKNWMRDDNRAIAFAQSSRDFERTGNLLHARLEHWISMNSGVCDPKDVEAIEAWKRATE